jgi:hypothetical protein
MQCPKCQYIRTPDDRHVMEGLCPACGIAYHKWTGSPQVYSEDIRRLTSRITFGQRLWATFTCVPQRVDGPSFWGRCVLLALFGLWGASFIVNGLNWQSIGNSFMHNINLPFHEFGHVLFLPFGRFMTILGGSLFQIMMPFMLLIGFSLHMRDNFAAAIMLWWTGQNFIDVSPYIADAPYRSLPLIGGMGDEAHDWGNLLTDLNCMSSAQTLANTSFVIGSLLICLSILWGVYMLIKQKAVLDQQDEFY